MDIEALTTIVLVVILMISSIWAVEHTNGYYVLCEYAFGRFLALLFILICTSINVASGLICLLVYMCLYILYLLNIKFWGNKDYVARYFNMYPNSEILSRNASMLAIDDYRFSSNRNDNKLFHTNKALIDSRIRNEDRSRSSLNNILYPPNQNKNQKVNPSEENTQTFFTPNFMSFQNY